MVSNIKNKKGFTLAEVLITLGIIGVVAAMTLPVLLTNIEKKTLETATKKFHSTISNAIRVYMAEENTDDLTNSELCARDDGSNWPEAQEAVEKFIQGHFNVTKKCDRNNADKCFAKTYRNYSGEGGKHDSRNFGCGKIFVINDGTVLTICAGDRWTPLHLYVDINGQNGPNVIGYDLWNMSIFYNGSVNESVANPENIKNGTAFTYSESRFQNNCRYSYGGCFGHFLNNGYKFDY